MFINERRCEGYFIVWMIPFIGIFYKRGKQIEGVKVIFTCQLRTSVIE